MKLTESEVKIINRSTEFVNRWFWYKWLLVLILLALVTFIAFYNGYIAAKYSLVINTFISITLGYLLSNWSTPKKEALLVKLFKNKKHT